MVVRGRLEWRRTALDLPLGLLLLLVLLQLAIGNGPLRDWALAPHAAGSAALPSPVFALGTVSPASTARALLLFLTYAAVYALTVNLVRRRRDLDRLAGALVLAGGVLAFLSIVDYLSRESWIFRWREGTRNTRLFGPFVNPDHWASWLVMLMCLGMGYLAARSVDTTGGREATLRRYLPASGVALMGLAAILTLSRGALLAAFTVGILLVFGLARVRGLRWSLILAATVGAATLAGLLWIGIDPLLERFGTPDRLGRFVQWRSSLPMLASFPVLGVGLGAYKDIYFHFQPAALLPGRVYFPYAHSDLLQLALETGLAGIALFAWAVCRVWRDLVGAHLLGRGRCPVGPAESAQRSDPFSVGIMLGALGAVAALLAHSVVDFSARIPADGVLAAACLGIATAAAHTRFQTTGAVVFTRIRSRALPDAAFPRAAVGAAACVLAAALVPLIVAPAAARPEPATVEGLRRSIASTPTDPYLHERLAWALERLAATDSERAGELRLDSRAHMERAVALQPGSPLLRHSQSALALAGPAPSIQQSVEAGRAAVERDPSLLPSLVDSLAPLALTDAQWISLVPPSAAHQAYLAALLESRAFLHEARAVYASALERASGGEELVIRWALALLLLDIRREAHALAEADKGVAKSPDNAELLLTRARALEALGRPETLDAYHTALTAAEGKSGPVFAVHSPLLQAVVSERLAGRARLSVTRYRRAYAQRLTDERRWSQALVEWERAQAEAPLSAREQFSRGK
jgi:O-antigen ligase